MDNQSKYQPKADGLNPKATFDPKQKGDDNAGKKGGKANSTQNILQLAEIRDGLVIMNDGSFRVVVFCRPINFVLMSEQERAAVEYSYQGFLNSLFFQIQIMVRSRRVDAGRYIEMLDKARQNQSNMLLELVMEDYVNFMADLIANTDIMDKFFYVVIPYSPVEEITKDNIARSTQGFFSKLFSFGRASNQLVVEESALNDAKRELRRRSQVVIEGLQQCGVMGAPLNTEELIELYYESYNPDASGGHQLASLRDLSTPLVTRAGEPVVAPQPAVAMPPLPQPAPQVSYTPPVQLPPDQPMPVQQPPAQPQPVPQPQLPPSPPMPMVEPAMMPPAEQASYPQPPQPPTPPQASAMIVPGQWSQPMPADPALNPYPPA